MIPNTPFKTLTLLIALLICSSPVFTVAQQPPGDLDAHAHAKRDADRDVNKLSWFGAGLLASLAPIAGFVLGGEGDGGKIIGAGVGLVVGASVPAVIIQNQKPTIPPDRFIGKPPEYIDRYTETYIQQTRWIKTKALTGGCLTPGCVIGAGAMVLVAAIPSNWQ